MFSKVTIKKQMKNMTVVTRLSLMQLVFVLVLTVVCYFLNVEYFVSAFLGGIICVLANFFFAGKLFLSRRYKKAEDLLQSFYRSEVMKLVFTVTMFVLVFLLVVDVNHAVFIVAYSLTTLLNLLCLPFLKD